jgi:hypothetical protein
MESGVTSQDAVTLGVATAAAFAAPLDDSLDSATVKQAAGVRSLAKKYRSASAITTARMIQNNR